MFLKAQKLHLGLSGRLEKDAQTGGGREGSLLGEPAGTATEHMVGKDQGPSLLNISYSHKYLNKLGSGPSAEPTLSAISWLPLPPQLFFIYLPKSEIC